MKIVNQTKHTTLAEDASVADSFFTRIKGLLGKKGLGRGQGLLLKPCNSVHTFFMQFPIDVLFINKNNTVVACLAEMLPGRASRIYWHAQYVVELPGGTIAQTSTAAGDTLTFA